MIPTRLRLLCVNLQPSAAGADPSLALDAVARAAQVSRAHVISLVGGSAAEVRAALGRLDGFSIVNGQRKWREGARQGCLLFKSDVVSVDNAKDIPLGEGDDIAVASVATVRVEGSKRPVLLTSVELHADNSKRRLDEGSALIRAMGALGFDGRMGQLVLGSFYEAPDQALYRMFTGRRTHKGVTGSFRDSVRVVNRGDLPGGWSTAGAAAVRADWILFDSAEVQEAHFLAPLEGQGWGELSHTPVFAEILL